jgi:DNA mismatch repair protein MutS2
MDTKSQHTLEFDKILARLAEYTSFSAGRELALHQRPTTDEGEARLWQEETQEARGLLDRRTDVTIGGARDVRQVVDRAERGYILQPEELLNVRATISAGRDLSRKLLRLSEEYPRLAQIAELVEECPGIVSAISEAVNEHGEVLDSASPELGAIRRQLQVVHGRIQDKLRALLSGSQNQYLQEPTITTRGGRYVVPLKANHKGRIKGIVHDTSNSGATLWLEPMNTVELNNEYRALQLAEEEEIQRILADLSARVADQGPSVKRVVERLAELDLIFARARYAVATNAVKPDFVPWRTFRPPKRGKKQARAGNGEQPADEAALARALHPGSTIWIRAARHPLLDPDTVVPTDLLLNEDTFVVLITGPNTGGKTVSLKTMGLMSLMAQSGLQLPAVEARLSVFENIFADIGDEQSIEQNLSTFSSHLTNIVRILKGADDRSLVLLDELGSGTDPAEGAALAQALVSYLRDQGATTFVATHYPELKVYASQTAGAVNASLLFDVETLMPTYEMSIGMPGRSNALAIARRLGLDESVLDEAMALVGAGSQRAESLLDTIYDMRERMTSQEAATRLVLRQAEEARDQLRRQLAEIEAERRQVLESARQEADQRLEAVREEIRQVRKQLRDAESRTQLKKLQRVTEEVEEQAVLALTPEPVEEERDARVRKRPEKLQVGDRVRVTTLGATGEVIDLDKDEVMVAIGRLHTRVSLDYLELRERRQDRQEDEAVPELTPSRAAADEADRPSPGMELDLRGRRVDEGLMTLEQYLERAYLSRLPWVRIIHGKGTGRMREAVRKALDGSGYVQGWEEGKDGEGGAGVTVARLSEE